MNRRTESEKGLNEKRQELSLKKKLIRSHNDLTVTQLYSLHSDIAKIINSYKGNLKVAS